MRQRRLIESGGIYFGSGAVASAAQVVARLLAEHPAGVTVAQARDAWGTTRKYALALLALLDSTGVTRRRDDLRIAGPRLPEPHAQANRGKRVGKLAPSRGRRLRGRYRTVTPVAARSIRSRRSSSFSPPQMPCCSPTSSAYWRQSACTEHTAQMSLARSSRRRFSSRFSTYGGGKKTDA